MADSIASKDRDEVDGKPLERTKNAVCAIDSAQYIQSLEKLSWDTIMNKGKLDAAMKAAIAQKTAPEQKIFMQLLRQVWQIDWTVPPYDVWGHYIAYDIPYFLRFMKADIGDEAEEKQLIMDWISSRLELGGKSKEDAKSWKKELIALLDEANQIRVEARKG
ncbi:MAG: hypothetical protein AB4290_24555 [Spirulina sp.]